MKIESKNNLYSHMHFTEHLVGAFGKSARKSNLNHKSSSLLIRRLKNMTGMSSCNNPHVPQMKIEINQSTPYSDRTGLSLSSRSRVRTIHEEWVIRTPANA
jgi:hypothetical protein